MFKFKNEKSFTQYHFCERKSGAGFTLIELIIVIGIAAILAVVVILVLNPAEFLKQSRDSRRMTELQDLNKALGLYQADGGSSFGSTNTIYVSIPSSQSNCSDLGLPSLPTGWSYACSNSTNYRKVDSNGWVPVNFTSVSFGSPLSILPVDPVNTTSTGNYYTYVKGGSWKLTTLMESEKYAKNMNKDGGPDPGVYEIGTNLSLANFARGLVGYWKFDEGSGTTTGDSSGKNNNGSVVSAITWRSGSECVNQNCVETASGGRIEVPYNSSLNLTTNVTYAHWIKIKTSIPASTWPYSLGNDSHKYIAWRSSSNSTNWMFEYGKNNPVCDGLSGSYTSTGGINIGTDTWHYLVMTYDGSVIKTYVDGVQRHNVAFSLGFCSNSSSPYYIAYGSASPGVYLVDEARIYLRALSAAEIMAIYNATK